MLNLCALLDGYKISGMKNYWVSLLREALKCDHETILAENLRDDALFDFFGVFETNRH